MNGGQANDLATEIREGFAGLWHGKPLGVTVAVLGVLLRAGLRFVAVRPGHNSRDSAWLTTTAVALLDRPKLAKLESGISQLVAPETAV